MAEIGRFFNGPSYDSQDFAEFFTNFLSTGFFNGLAVTADSATMNVTIEAGSAFIEGHEYRNTDPLTKLVGTADATNPRIDRIVVRKDSTPEAENPLQILVRAGVAATDPEPPDLVRNEGIYEISLAQVLVEAGKSFIEPSQITDERGDKDVAGRVSNPAKLTEQIDSIDVKDPTVKPSQYTEGSSTFYISGDGHQAIFQQWLDSLGVSASDYGRNISSLRAYVRTIGSRSNTGMQTFTLFAWDYQNEYEIYGEWKRANNAISTDIDWGRWEEVVFVYSKGSNSNGDYVMYSDGRLECTHTFNAGSRIAVGEGTYSDPYRTTTSNWTFPTGFSSPPTVTATGVIDDSGAWNRANTINYRSVSTTSVSNIQAMMTAGGSGDVNVTIHITAVGRWR